MRISVIDTQEKILTKVLMLKGEKGDKGDAGEITNLDTALSPTSTNAVQNKVITNALNTLNGIRQDNAGFHNSIYRGKFLGTSITAEQYAQISAGTFDDMFIGDYWTIPTTFGSTTKNVDYVIAGFDYWWNVGDSYPQTTNKHHIVLVPRDVLYTASMNDTNTTAGGYIGSKMYTDNLADARTGISNAFSGHLYSVRRMFSSGVGADGQANVQSWATSTVDLMSENMVLGTKVWGNNGYEIGCDRCPLPLFTFDTNSAFIRDTWWLRSISSASSFVTVGLYGNTSVSVSSNVRGVRPCFALYGGD